MLDVSEARQLAQQGSISGALIGGVMFGCGMVLARGCASRLLVLSANGNLRALLSGLVFAVTAQASYRGLLSPAREWLTNLWFVDGGPSRDIMGIFGGGTPEKLGFGGHLAARWSRICFRSQVARGAMLSAIAAGTAVATGWLFTYSSAQSSFAPVTLKSLTFSGPSAELLMVVLNSQLRLGFDLGIMPGVLSAHSSRRPGARTAAKGMSDGLGMRRYLFGAVLMGFGAMLAGGCAVGAGVTGASVFALTAWIVLGGMCQRAGLTDLLVDRSSALPLHEAASSAVPKA